MKLEANGITIELEFDGDGFPLISIDTGGGFYAENNRPTVEVKLNDVEIHDMFDEDDGRWIEEADKPDGYICGVTNCDNESVYNEDGDCPECGHPLLPVHE